MSAKHSDRMPEFPSEARAVLLVKRVRDGETSTSVATIGDVLDACRELTARYEAAAVGAAQSEEREQP